MPRASRVAASAAGRRRAAAGRRPPRAPRPASARARPSCRRIDSLRRPRARRALSQGGDRLARPLELLQREREVLVGLGEVGALGDHLRASADGLRVAAAGVGVDHLVDLAVDPDQVLGVVGRPCRRSAAGAAARGVAEAAQAGRLLGARRRRAAAARPTPAAAPRAGRGRVRRSSAKRLCSSRGSRGEVVELRERQRDHFLPPRSSAAQRRPAAVEAADSDSK